MATAALFRPPWQGLADQLARVWGAIGITSSIAGIPVADRAPVLAEQLWALGVRDLSRLSMDTVERYTGSDSRAQAGALVDWSQYRGAPFKSYHFLAYEGVPIGYLSSSVDGSDQSSIEADPYDPGGAGVLDLWDPAGAGHIKFRPVSSPSGVVVFVPQWASSSDVPVEVIAVLSLTAMFAGLPALIGEAVLGAQAAAYPLAAKAIGTVAVQTVLTGGDVERAVTSAAASFAGGQFGDVVGTGLDSAEIGRVAAAAATAAVQGGDVEKAVIRSLVDIGANKVDDYLTDYSDTYVDIGTVTSDDMEYLTFDDLGLEGIDAVDLDSAIALNEDTFDLYGVDTEALTVDDEGNVYTASGAYVELADTVYVESMYVDDQGNIRGPDNNIIMEATEVEVLSADAVAARVAEIMASNAGTVTTSSTARPGRPDGTPPPAADTKWPSISDATKFLDAVGKFAAQLKSTAAAVKTGTYRPPAPGTQGTPRNTPIGVPTRQPDGTIVTNNGNGTQTVKYPDGRVVTTGTTYRAGAGGSLLPGVSNQVLFIGGIALVGVALLARRK